MKAEDLKTKTIDELTKSLLDLKKQQFNLRFQASQGQLGQTAQVRQVRRDIARIKTVMGEKRRTEGTVTKAKAAAGKPKAKKSGSKAA